MKAPCGPFRRALMNGLVCGGCGKWHFADERGLEASIRYHTGPWLCQMCNGQMPEPQYQICCECRVDKDHADWERLEQLAEPFHLMKPSAPVHGLMVYALASHRWFDDLEDYLDHCAATGTDPEDGLPVWGRWKTLPMPDLWDAVSDDWPEDEDCPDWLDELQRAVEAAWKRYQPGAYHDSRFRPILPTAQEWAEMEKVSS